jgi:hypothetical protein
MNVLKSEVVTLLRSRGLVDRAAWADRALPDVLDVRHHASLLETLQIDPKTLTPVDAAARSE